MAVQTDIPDAGGATVWRLAQHRSDIRRDDDPSRIYFWYTPRPNVSRDGRWVLFTSNWEKSLGRDPSGEAGGKFRQDVFVLALRTAAPAGAAAPIVQAPGSGSRGRHAAPPVGTAKPKHGGPPLS